MAFAIRATRKALRRLGGSVVPEAGPPTTALGDWYVNVVHVGQTQFVLCTSDRSLLSVVLPARRLKSELHSRLREGVAELLTDLGIPGECIARELHEMSPPVISRTSSRSVLGSMNDFAYLLEVAVRTQPNISLRALSLELSGTPCQPLAAQYQTAFPDHVARRLLGCEERPAG